MYVLVFAPHGLVGEEGSTAYVSGTYAAAKAEMNRQLIEYEKDHGIDLGYAFSDDWHAAANVYAPDSAEWHIYEV